MGMLAYGAAAGVGDEYLKQSAETRKNDFQDIRDKRLSELKKSELTHGADLQETSAAAARKHGDENYSFGYGENVVRSGEVVNQGADRPVAGGSKVVTSPIQLVSGDTTTYDEQRKSWEGMAFTKDEFGNQVRNTDVPEFDEWFNARVLEKHRINPDTGQPDPVDVEPSTASYDQARKEASDQAGYLSGDKADFGPGGREPWIEKRAREIEAENKGVKTPSSKLTPPKDDGMLTEGLEENKPAALKRPLSQASKTDPVQMYDELMSQDFDEQTVIDTIRRHFNDATWEVPPNALM